MISHTCNNNKMYTLQISMQCTSFCAFCNNKGLLRYSSLILYRLFFGVMQVLCCMQGMLDNCNIWHSKLAYLDSSLFSIRFTFFLTNLDMECCELSSLNKGYCSNDRHQIFTRIYSNVVSRHNSESSKSNTRPVYISV